nr:MAG TPA: HNHc [Caudoviricetes sp.]DAY29662.1 MAG TPA: HNHc [Caudoviricetes sp.]
MARPKKTGLEFPKWNPQFFTRLKFRNSNQKVRYKALRNSSDSFIKRKDVRDFLLEKYNYQCSICGSTDSLEIDHIISVFKASIKEFDIDKLNNIENLTVLCRKCNSGKQV